MTWIILLWIFQGYSLFSYQCSLLFSATLIYYHNHLCLSTTFLFYFVHHLMSERRRRDLNPRAAINDLHPFQGCPFSHLGYFSMCWFTFTNMTISRLYLEDSIHSHAPQDYLLESNGEGGIRTHAPFRTNGFQDRLVMTASIPLRVIRLIFWTCRVSSAQDVFYQSFTGMSTLFFIFFTFFVKSRFFVENSRFPTQKKHVQIL